MKTLMRSLYTIKELLEQIHAITQNQTTVLLDTTENADTLDMLEEMFEYKGNLMNELEQVEAKFQEAYQEIRGQLEGREELIILQKEISEILKLKDEIVAIEQSNLLLMENKRRRQVEKVELPKDPVKISEAYKKYTRPIK